MNKILKYIIWGILCWIVISFLVQKWSPDSQDTPDEQKAEEPQTQIEPRQRHIPTVKPKQEEIDFGTHFDRKYTWGFDNREWYSVLTFHPSLYNIYQERSRKRDYDLFASDPYDDPIIKQITDSLSEAGKKHGLRKEQIPYFVVSFVQSLPYTSDDVTSGYDEYPRFPYETLYNNGGDCEDTSILMASMLQEMGYGVVLIKFKNHLGVGVKCESDMPGYHYTYEDESYCYLETTGDNIPLGYLAEEYVKERAIIKPLYKRPFLDVDFVYTYKYDLWTVSVDVNVTVTNLGSEEARNTKIYVALQTKDESKVWDKIESDYLQIAPEDGYNYQVTNLKTGVGNDFRVYARAFGDNVISGERYGEWIIWE